MREILGAAAALCVAISAVAQTLEQRHFVRQSSLFESQDIAVRADAVSINGRFVHAGRDLSMDEFLAVREEEVIDWLSLHLRYGGHLADIGAVLASGQRPVFHIILDIEGLVHPAHLWKYWDPVLAPEPRFSKQEVADAFAMRLRAARTVLSRDFPGQEVELGLFGTLKPHGFGYPTDATYLKRRDALIELCQIGMLDDADFLVPVLFPRFASEAVRYDAVEQYVSQGLDGSAMMRRSDGASMPLFPVLAFRIFNGGQPPGLVGADWLDRALATIRASDHELAAIGFWVGPLISDRCARAYTKRLFAPQDWDHDCVLTAADLSRFDAGFARSDPMADLNRDGVWDDADLGIWDDLIAGSSAFPCDRSVDCPCALDIFDFLQFQKMFSAGDHVADINGDHRLDLFDFLAFQQLMEDACP